MVGDYRLEQVLGAGGMGTVYEAVNTATAQRVALKVLHRELCGDGEAIPRFVQEARAASRVGHPNIVDVLAAGTTADGCAYLAMELLHGESLEQRLGRALALDEACHILVEITHALEAVHAAGIIHRDLKPDNIFLTKRRAGFPGVKLLDFGVAKLAAGDALSGPGRVTRNGVVVGTPRYVSPEQARCQPLDARVDTYALGVVAFEMFTGRPPFVADKGIDLIAKHLMLRPPAPSEIEPRLPALVDEIVGAMLAKEREQRPPLSEIRAALLEIPRAPRSTAASELAASRARATKIVDTARRRSWLIWSIAAMALIALSIVVVAALR